jgi:organic radical activating enzyme
MTDNKFELAAIHFSRKCNLNCSFCYRPHNKIKELPRNYWIRSVKYLKELGVEQIALGGGEPFLEPEFIKRFSKECLDQNMIFNITTNGTPLFRLNNIELAEVLTGVTMVSVSLDSEKIRHYPDGLPSYFQLVERINDETETLVGCNLLVTDHVAKNIVPIVKMLFDVCGVDRIFALCPKNIPAPDILKVRNSYLYLTSKYPNFYVDDLTNKIVTEGKYKNWRSPCHFGKLLSIDEQGFVKGCSFDTKSLFRAKTPKELLKAKTIKIQERHNCPYLQV